MNKKNIMVLALTCGVVYQDAGAGFSFFRTTVKNVSGGGADVVTQASKLDTNVLRKGTSNVGGGDNLSSIMDNASNRGNVTINGKIDEFSSKSDNAVQQVSRGADEEAEQSAKAVDEAQQAAKRAKEVKKDITALKNEIESLEEKRRIAFAQINVEKRLDNAKKNLYELQNKNALSPGDEIKRKQLKDEIKKLESAVGNERRGGKMLSDANEKLKKANAKLETLNKELVNLLGPKANNVVADFVEKNILGISIAGSAASAGGIMATAALA